MQVGGSVSENQDVTVGVDTHKDVHVAAVLDQTGRVLGTRGFPTTMRGYAQLATWAESFGTVAKVGLEGSGSYGAGLLRFLTDYGLVVIEVDRPDRSTRRRIGKTDTIDAESAARAVLSGRATGTPKTRDAQVEMIRALRVARRGAMKARIQAGGQLEGLIVTAPEPVRQLVRGLAGKTRIRVCATLRPGTMSDPTTATKVALRRLARRWLTLQAKIDDLDSHLAALVTSATPELIALPGVGVDTAGQLLVTAGDNPHRLHSEAAFARLCGVAPIPASSGRTDRHRLHRGGDRDANRALWRITLVRMRCHQPTKDYVTRRTAEGKTKTEIMRCLKRYIARETFPLLQATVVSAAMPDAGEAWGDRA
ncbi:IS110 family transposase [Micromonospora sp. NPDC047557]|uniref:IS110 family transposase n=1 Tax=Micromonospora sp. NPDC047557 TaxID=3364250 RepID=UPI0037110CC5